MGNLFSKRSKRSRQSGRQSRAEIFERSGQNVPAQQLPSVEGSIEEKGGEETGSESCVGNANSLEDGESAVNLGVNSSRNRAERRIDAEVPGKSKKVKPCQKIVDLCIDV